MMCFDLQEFGLGVLRIVGAGERAFGAGAQLGLKVADLRVRAGCASSTM